MKIFKKWSAELGILSGLAVSFGLNSAVELLGRRNVTAFLKYLVENPLVFFYNTLIVFLTISIASLSKRRIFMKVMLSALWILLGIVNCVLLSFRVTPFTAVDLRLAKFGFSLLDTYFTKVQIGGIVLACLAVIAGIAAIWKKAPVVKERIPYINAVAMIGLTALFVTGCTKAGIRTNLLSVNFGNIADAYQEYGFAYCFSNSLINTGIDKPKGYNDELVETISRKEILPDETAPVFAHSEGEKKAPDIIFVQLESFFDPQNLNDVIFSRDPIPNFRSLAESNSSGTICVPSVGAGTANTEFEVISGMNLDFFGPGEYPYKTILQKSVCESISYNLKELGYKAHAIHNNEGTFYDRNTVFSQLGFDTFTSIEYMNGIEENPIGWAKDEILTGEIRKALDSAEESSFIYAISVQGHGAYPTEGYEGSEWIQASGEGVRDESRKHQIEYYVNQIHEMDAFIKELVDSLNERGREYVLVMYGDHLPTLGITESELKNGSLYETPYVAVTNMNLPKVDRKVEAYQLTAHILNQLGIHKGTMIRYHQKYLMEDKPNEEVYLEDMRVLEYDMLYGDYEVYEGVLPFAATKLQMGISPILVKRVDYQDSVLTITGMNFTEYSNVNIDGKTMETTFVSPDTLTVRLKEFEGEHEIIVEQIGRDRAVLSSTLPYSVRFQ